MKSETEVEILSDDNRINNVERDIRRIKYQMDRNSYVYTRDMEEQILSRLYRIEDFCGMIGTPEYSQDRQRRYDRQPVFQHYMNHFTRTINKAVGHGNSSNLPQYNSRNPANTPASIHLPNSGSGPVPTQNPVHPSEIVYHQTPTPETIPSYAYYNGQFYNQEPYR